MLGEVESSWKNYNMNLFLCFLLVLVHKKAQLEYTCTSEDARRIEQGKGVKLKYKRFSKKRNTKLRSLSLGESHPSSASSLRADRNAGRVRCAGRRVWTDGPGILLPCFAL